MVTVLFLTGIPVGIMIIPVFQIFALYGWLSLIPTGIFLGANSLPFALWLMKTAIDGVPKEMEEAGRDRTSEPAADDPACGNPRLYPRHRVGGDLQLHQRLGLLHRAAGAGERPVASDRAVDDLRADRGGECPLR